MHTYKVYVWVMSCNSNCSNHERFRTGGAQIQACNGWQPEAWNIISYVECIANAPSTAINRPVLKGFDIITWYRTWHGMNQYEEVPHDGAAAVLHAIWTLFDLKHESTEALASRTNGRTMFLHDDHSIKQNHSGLNAICHSMA